MSAHALLREVKKNQTGMGAPLSELLLASVELQPQVQDGVGAEEGAPACSAPCEQERSEGAAG